MLLVVLHTYQVILQLECLPQNCFAMRLGIMSEVYIATRMEVHLFLMAMVTIMVRQALLNVVLFFRITRIPISEMLSTYH
ncbi:hypothetical protein VC35_03600 [Pseudomonas fluorescens]|uniref:Uncharacterized protein n=1 Tax=Pseudomonas fluorescens TaxID=294 RepID=A0A0F4TZC2_PSEFL|nr:hypothetical protein VC35_03600 [Pseudomonas fluorescens]